jgi:dipeptidyl aminopeptidase/acylaminoacyl peptidase
MRLCVVWMVPMIMAIALGTACTASTQAPDGPQRFTIDSEEARLAATLILPEGGKPPYPGVVLVHGSGQVTAAQMMGTANRLVRLGVAALTYDKRGVGGSTGEYASVGSGNSERMFDLLSRDALAAVAALRARRDVDPKRIGLVGISQGGWIAPLAATIDPGIAFVVTISGPAVSVGEEIAYSRLAGEDPGSQQGVSDDEIARRMSAFQGPHGYDPLPILAKLDRPSLWILGEHDRSIPLRRTVEILTTLKTESQRPITTHVIPGVNHSLRNPVTGAFTDFWNVVADWLKSIGIVRT